MVKKNPDLSLAYLPTHLPVLDGWRGISISCVLAGHMLPLGPKVLGLNGMVATAGMSAVFLPFGISHCLDAVAQ